LKFTFNRYLLSFSILALILITVFILSFFHHRDVALFNAVTYLEQSGKLREKFISNWRKERIGDSRVIQANELIADEIKKLITNESNSSIKNSFVKWLETVQNEYGYKSAYLYNNKLDRVILKTDGSELNLTYPEKTSAEILSRNDVHLSDFYLNEGTDEVSIELYVPFTDKSDEQPFAFVIFRIDPSVSLLPYLVWSGPEESGEVLIARSEEDSIRFLTNLKKYDINPLRYKISKKDAQNFFLGCIIKGFFNI